MGLALLVLGLILFLGPHVFVTMRAQRDGVVARMGEWPYKGLFAVVTVVGLFVLAKGFALYRDAGPIEVWDPPNWTRHITVALMWPAVILRHRGLYPRRHQAHPEASDAGGREAVGGGASHLQRRPRHRSSCSARSSPGRCMTASPSSAAAIPARPPIPIGGRRNDVVAIVVGTILYFALGLVFHPLVIGRAVFGTPALGT